MLVEGFHSAFEGSELHHGVGHLSEPQRHDTLVESVNTFVLLDLVEAFRELRGEVGGLLSHFQLHIYN